MMIAVALALAIIVFAAAFHLHWAFGGDYGFSVSLPQTADGRPIFEKLVHLWRLGAFFVAIGLLGVGALALMRADLLDGSVPPQVTRGVLLFAAVAFIARALAWSRYVGFFKQLRTTRWARYDTRFYCPLFLTLGVSLLYLAVR